MYNFFLTKTRVVAVASFAWKLRSACVLWQSASQESREDPPPDFAKVMKSHGLKMGRVLIFPIPRSISQISL